MFTINGKYTSADVMIDGVDEATMAQIYKMVNHPAFTNKVVIMPDCHKGTGSVIGFTMPITDRIVPNVVGVDIGCFTSDTKIPLLNGVQYSLDELTHMGEFYVYSMDENLQIVPGRAKALKTRVNAELMEVVVSGGERLRCTPDHLFMMSDGTYKEAKDLSVMDSLMPFYRTYTSRDGLEYVFSAKQRAIRTHLMVARCIFGKQNKVVHHKNVVWYNNDPSNLEYLTPSEHSKLHRKIHTSFSDDNFQEKKNTTIKKRGWQYRPELHEKKVAVGIENITTYMRDHHAEWKEKIKDNGKRGAEFFRKFNAVNNSTTFTCEVCGRKILGKGGFVRHTNWHKRNSESLNHKVLYTRILDYKEDVYCLQVETYHNFALAAGVFVHNCGMLSLNIQKPTQSLEEVDQIIRAAVPMGFSIRSKPFDNLERIDSPENRVLGTNTFWNRLNWNSTTAKQKMPEVPFPHYDYEWFKGFCKRIGIEVHTACNSLGTLGGGNHFIEIGVSENTGYWLTIHTGSRNLGLKVAKYWQDKAVNVTEQEHKERIATVLRETRDKTEIEQRIEWIKADYNGDKELMFLTGERMHGYLIDMLFAQQYAAENRNWILLAMKRALGFEYNDDINVWNTYKLMGRIESVHNYIDFHDMIIRKGAIKSEYLMIIPFNMRDGLLICKGKDNPDWNFSAPHGAGRLMGRGEAKRKLDMQEFTEQMGGIVSSSVCEGTLDEAPSAYKSAALIESLIEPTVTIVDRVKPVLNIKSL